MILVRFFSTLLNDQNSIHLFPFQLLFVRKSFTAYAVFADIGWHCSELVLPYLTFILKIMTSFKQVEISSHFSTFIINLWLPDLPTSFFWKFVTQIRVGMTSTRLYPTKCGKFSAELKPAKRINVLFHLAIWTNIICSLANIFGNFNKFIET